MIDATSTAALQNVLARESRSLLQYIGATFPWPAAKNSSALDELLRLIRAESAVLIAIGQLLLKHRVTPATHSTFPSSFTSLNFVQVEYLLPRLIETEKSLLAELEQDAAAITCESARDLIERLRAVKLENLSKLESLAAAHHPAA